MLNRSLIVFLAIIAFSADGNPTVNTNVSVADLIQMLHDGGTISNSIIDADVLAAALKNVNQTGISDTDTPLEITDSTIDGDLDFQEIGKPFPVNNPTNSVVSIPLEFDSVVFKGAVLGNNCTFTEDFSLQRSTNLSIVQFCQATFQKQSRFDGSEFDGASWFMNATFNDRAGFKDAHFHGEALFGDAVFQEWAFFENTTFDGRAVFANVQFAGKADFNQAKFLAGKNGDKFEVNFGNATFHKPAYFVSCTMLGTVDFWGETKFESDAFFTSINNSAISNAETGMLKFLNVQFNGRAYFTQSHIDRLTFSKGVGLHDKDISEDESGPVLCEGRADFSRLSCRIAEFQNTEFRSYTDFSDARILERFDLRKALFESDLSLDRSTLPSQVTFVAGSENSEDKLRCGILLNDCRFHGNVFVIWNQLSGGMFTTQEETWLLLEDLFKTAGRSGPHPLDHGAQKIRWTLPVCCHFYFCLSVVHSALQNPFEKRERAVREHCPSSLSVFLGFPILPPQAV